MCIESVKGADANYTDKYGDTALHWTCFEGHFDVVEMLIEHGCDMNLQNTNGYTALFFAVSQNHARKITEMLN